MSIKTLNTKEEFDTVSGQESFFLLKHSLTCPISASAKEEYEAFHEGTSTPCYILPVQKARPLSDYLAESLNVKHESPQVLLIKNERVVWHDSHSAITKDALRDSEHYLS
ncbi:bacillithiol system redox-active protein YtxJ [Thalassobacillus pellis]|uniref:bacillithiol system redox-active protein YtxJ n=1 Tax=Thalassobacillus pellis TaxID=748008 RepID=UPI001960EA45|nr:bacillithiol system protein YtxJ [Thalassobacillus pellis]